jgi:hypothetical protein
MSDKQTRRHFTPQEKVAIARGLPTEGHRRRTFMMLEADAVACGPASVDRVLKGAGLLAGQAPNVTKKGTGYVQPLQAHQEWQVDVSYLNIAGIFWGVATVGKARKPRDFHQVAHFKTAEVEFTAYPKNFRSLRRLRKFGAIRIGT